MVDTTFIIMTTNFFASFCQVVAIIAIITYASYWFLVAIVPLLFVYLLIINLYRGSSRELKRLDSVNRTPLFNHFSESLAGIATIRAYGEQDHFIEVSKRRTD